MIRIYAKVNNLDETVSRIWEQDEEARLPNTEGYRYEIIDSLFDIHNQPTITSVPVLSGTEVTWLETGILQEAIQSAIFCSSNSTAKYEPINPLPPNNTAIF